MNKQITIKHEKQGIYIYWNLYHTCALNCAWCFLRRPFHNPVFVRERSLRMANIIAELAHLSPSISFAGGEPEQHPFLPEILSSLAGKMTVTIHTTAYQSLEWHMALARKLPGPVSFRIYSHPEKSDQEHLLKVALMLAGGGHAVNLEIMRDFWNEEATARAESFFREAGCGLDARICSPYELLPNPVAAKGANETRIMAILPDSLFSMDNAEPSGQRLYDLDYGNLEQILGVSNSGVGGTIFDDFQSCLGNVPLWREEVELINPQKTSVVTFAALLPEVRKYFSESNYAEIPAIYLAGNVVSNAEELGKSGVDLLDNMPEDRKGDLLYFSKPGVLLAHEHSMKSLIEQCAGLEYRPPLKYFRFAFPQRRREPIPYFYEKNATALRRIFSSIEDRESKKVFLGAIRSLETGDPGYLPISAYEQYRHPAAAARAGDIVIDGGLFDTGTVASFALQTGDAGHVYGFEPDPQSCGRISKALEGNPSITIINAGLGAKRERLKFAQAAYGGHIARGNEESISVSFTDIDSWLGERSLRCDLIKLDVEGAEPAVLKGAINTIKNFRPRLHISIYHLPAHYYELPLWILENFPDYKLYFGHHTPWLYETILYAVPA